MFTFTEEDLENTSIDYFKELGYEYKFGIDIAPDGDSPERKDYSDVILTDRLKDSLYTINTGVPNDIIDEAIKKILIPQHPDLIVNNRDFHKMITDGIDVEYKSDNRILYNKVFLFDFREPERNDWLIVNQFTVIENNINKRPDIVVFVNGLPLVVIELKSPSDESANINKAFIQIQNYITAVPSLFVYNTFSVISDGLLAKSGTITSNKERFMNWRTIDGEHIEPLTIPQLEVLIKGIFDKRIFLDLIKHFIVFQDDGKNIKKILSAYHQYHAVNKAVKKTGLAISGDKRIGVVWHTQGSGKSLTMVFYTGKLVLNFDNPTVIILTDRNDLDNQLFSTFSTSKDLLRQTPKQAGSRKDLRELLSVESGGIIFTTIQKFSPDEGDVYPVLTNRDNVIVIADEAHRSQYGFSAKVSTTKEETAYIKYGYAKYLRDALPNASFVGFSGTPIEKEDKSTPAVFGDYIDIYDMTRAVEDETTVKIFYESRIVKIDLPESEIPLIDSEFEEITEEQEDYNEKKLKSKWSRLEALVGTDKRLTLVAKDLISHYEKRQEASFGKVMIVTMSRRIAVDLYNKIISIRPEWHNDSDKKGVIKVVMTGSSSDPQDWQPFITNKKRREYLSNRMKDEKDPLKIVIVRDMWLTGFDVPCLNTMYVDKPMGGHNLMQAIARVNRVFKDKQGGLVVDYIGIADSLKKALSQYTDSDKGTVGIDTQEAIAVMKEKYEIIKDMLHGFDYSKFFTGNPSERMRAITETINHILGFEEGRKKDFVKFARELALAYSLCTTTEEAKKINEEVGFFKTLRASLIKMIESNKGKTKEEIDIQIKQLISKSVVSEEVVDILNYLGFDRPDISILSDKFLEEVKGIPHKNIAVELLKKLLNDKIKTYSRKNLIKSRKFSEMLSDSILKYNKRGIETAEVINELVNLAKDINKEQQQGKDLGLSEDEVAFYDAICLNDSAVKIMGDDILKKIAVDLTKAIKNSATVDWNLRESVRAKMRVTVKKLLRKYGYPPDKQPEAIKTVLQQAELMCA